MQGTARAAEAATGRGMQGMPWLSLSHLAGDRVKTAQVQERPKGRLMALAKALATIVDDANAGADDIATFVALARYTDSSGCHSITSQTTMAKMLRKSRPWVNARLKHLEDLGYAEKKHRFFPRGGGQQSNRYYLPTLDTGNHACQPADILPSQKGDTPLQPADTNLPLAISIKPSLSARGGGRSYRTSKLIPEDWQPTDADLEWARQERPDIDNLARFTAKFVSKVNAGGGTHTCPSTKWRQWLATEHVPATPRPSGKKGLQKTQLATAPDVQVPEAKDAIPVIVDQPQATMEEASPLPALPAAPSTPSPIPAAVRRAVTAAKEWAGIQTFTMTDAEAGRLEGMLIAGQEELAALFKPTDPHQVRAWMVGFAERRGFSLPKDEYLKADIIAVSKALPSDLFEIACMRLWERFSYRRLPEPPDFINSIKPLLDAREEARRTINAMTVRLKGRQHSRHLATRH